MEVERRMCFLVIENRMTRNAISASTFPGHPRCNSIPSCWISMLRGVFFWSFLHLLSDTFGAGRPAPKTITSILYGVMIPYGKCLVNYAQGRLPSLLTCSFPFFQVSSEEKQNSRAAKISFVSTRITILLLSQSLRPCISINSGVS